MSLYKYHIPGIDEQKYHARRMEIDGHSFDSTAEGNRYLELKLLESAGEIRDLELQPSYPLVVNGVKIGVYRADFRYVDCKEGTLVVEDVKGVKTEVYRLKRKLLMALYNIDILETGGG